MNFERNGVNDVTTKWLTTREHTHTCVICYLHKWSTHL